GDLLAVGGDGPALRQVGLDQKVRSESRERAVHELEHTVARECRHLVGIEVRRLALAGDRQDATPLRRLCVDAGRDEGHEDKPAEDGGGAHACHAGFLPAQYDGMARLRCQPRARRALTGRSSMISPSPHPYLAIEEALTARAKALSRRGST